MKKILLLINFTLFASVALAQNPKITECNPVMSDSSYYDAIAITDSHIWFVGKYGIITELKDGIFSSISGPFNGNNILSCSKINNEDLILTGDRGNVYIYNIVAKRWRSLKVNGFEKSCFYSVLALNDREIIICGGNLKIARSQKAIPNGFIIKSDDGGISWRKVYTSPFNMIWKIKNDRVANKIYVNLYHPNRSIILYSSNGGNTWEKTGISEKGLIHDYEIQDNINKILVGGANIGKWNNSLIFDNDRLKNYSNNGFAWGIRKHKNYYLMSCGNSNISYKKVEEVEWKTIKLNEKINKNIYNTVQANDHTFYAFGSGKTIYKIEFE